MDCAPSLASISFFSFELLFVYVWRGAAVACMTRHGRDMTPAPRTACFPFPSRAVSLCKPSNVAPPTNPQNEMETSDMFSSFPYTPPS